MIQHPILRPRRWTPILTTTQCYQFRRGLGATGERTMGSPRRKAGGCFRNGTPRLCTELSMNLETSTGVVYQSLTTDGLGQLFQRRFLGYGLRHPRNSEALHDLRTETVANSGGSYTKGLICQVVEAHLRADLMHCHAIPFGGLLEVYDTRAIQLGIWDYDVGN